MKAFVKYRIKQFLVLTAKIIRSQPMIKKVCKKILSQFPKLYLKLCAVLRSDMKDLSPAAENRIIHGMPGNVYQTYLSIKNEEKTNESCY